MPSPSSSVDPEALLKTHWGYASLRPLQRKVLDALLDDKDVLAVLPTGAGKSLCFQLAALCRPGIALVLTPLVALMHEQVNALQRRGISAVALDSSMSAEELQWSLDRCLGGHFKFLYLSLERLAQPAVLKLFKRLPLALFVLDEAHCLSSWGYDFRPAYGRLGDVRAQLPVAPAIALTATAPPAVRQEIMSAMAMKEAVQVIGSMSRPHFSYLVRHSEKKFSELEKLLGNVSGSALIYAPTRKSAETWSQKLRAKGHRCAAYHAGLSATQRRRRMLDWYGGKTPLMVATSALSMGIHKEDLALVVHMYVPESLSSYYQESGRAGRSNQATYAVLIYGSKDLKNAQEQANERIPDPEFTRRVYQALGNFYQLPMGSGCYFKASFDLLSFAKRYRLAAVQTHYALQRLVAESIIELHDGMQRPSSLRLMGNHVARYAQELQQPMLARINTLLLRKHGGRIYEEYVRISEARLAEELQCTTAEISAELRSASNQHLLHYRSRGKGMELTFLCERMPETDLPLRLEAMHERTQRLREQATQMEAYLHSTSCRATYLLGVLGEENAPPCGRCDVCRTQRNTARQEEKKDQSLLLSRKEE